MNNSWHQERGISDMISVVLILSLVVILTAIVIAMFLGYMPALQKPQLSAFAVNRVPNDTYIELHMVTGDTLNANKGAGSSPGVTLTNISITITNPSGLSSVVNMCASMPSTTVVTPGKSLYIFKRSQPVYYLATSPSATNCGGGGGGGGGGTNVAFSPSGIWRIVIADTKNSNTVLFDGNFQI